MHDGATFIASEKGARGVEGLSLFRARMILRLAGHPHLGLLLGILGYSIGLPGAQVSPWWLTEGVLTRHNLHVLVASCRITLPQQQLMDRTTPHLHQSSPRILGKVRSMSVLWGASAVIPMAAAACTTRYADAMAHLMQRRSQGRD